ncbi:pyridoxamine 5'-phosphate oxidase family protein [Streptomyces sp. NPDC057280]|uniref:pyridoxamine 5'-phosphate oxidase family protein n=1 Tax=Streptomyces sp. NPDC057280 TaxID=3346081 RepID=UPI0036278EE2
MVSTLRADGAVHASVVNLAVMPHPLGDGSVVAFVTAGKAKLHSLRARPRLAATARAGWSWATVEGKAEIIGPYWLATAPGRPDSPGWTVSGQQQVAELRGVSASWLPRSSRTTSGARSPHRSGRTLAAVSGTPPGAPAVTWWAARNCRNQTRASFALRTGFSDDATNFAVPTRSASHSVLVREFYYQRRWS